MGQFLIVSKADRLADYCQIAQSYQVGFEYNDFYDPVVLSDEERLDGIWQQYDACRKPSICTMHGAFLDVTVFSADPGGFRAAYAAEHAAGRKRKGVGSGVPYQYQPVFK